MSSLRAFLGRPVADAVGGRRRWIGDAVVAADLSRALGLVVDTSSGPRRFMPWLAVFLVGGDVSAEAAPPMLGEAQLAHYLANGVCLTRLTGQLVDAGDGRPSLLNDVLVGREGQIEGLELACDGLTRVVPTTALAVRRPAPGVPGLAIEPVWSLLAAAGPRLRPT